ncbi:MAG: hypothetical protein K0S07_622 [Chlamydiales bacterium]|jgi:hypothetical protein|nr:hypothetical protein [Chlamydiales bacterium]
MCNYFYMLCIFLFGNTATPLAAVTFSPTFEGSAQAEKPRDQATATAYYNHTIIHAYQNNEGHFFVLLDDLSLWKVNPSHNSTFYNSTSNNHPSTDVNGQITYPFFHQPLTLMPNSGSAAYPMLFIANLEALLAAKLVASPIYEKQIVHFDREKGELTIAYPGQAPFTIFIYPAHWRVVENWQQQHRLLEGGVWMPEFNSLYSFGHYPYILYNYATSEFVMYGTESSLQIPKPMP